ncbi:hypothetical protein [Candidatus Poriferisocius sp.]|uniref:hypothetical protein n=1 Tax=Candidatus Poriferisocius sp. TaxID=3101276 RepID=UPI003B02D571
MEAAETLIWLTEGNADNDRVLAEVRRELAVVDPSHSNNVYNEMDLLPDSKLSVLGPVRVRVLNTVDIPMIKGPGTHRSLSIVET